MDGIEYTVLRQNSTVADLVASSLVGQYLIQGKSERMNTETESGNAVFGRNVHYLTNLSIRIEFRYKIRLIIQIILR